MECSHNYGPSTAQNLVVSRAAELVYGRWAGILVALLVAGPHSLRVLLLVGDSRIPYAAARDGNFFAIFQRLDPSGHFPDRQRLVSRRPRLPLLRLQLRDLVSARVVIRYLLLFLLQAVGAVLWRITNPAQPRPFRMWLYPLPGAHHSGGFTLVLLDKLPLLGRGSRFLRARAWWRSSALAAPSPVALRRAASNQTSASRFMPNRRALERGATSW